MRSDDAVLQRLCAEATNFLGQLDERPVSAPVPASAVKERLNTSLPARGTAPEKVVAELIEDFGSAITANAGPRFYGWVMGGVLPSALGADWLTSLWDQNAATAISSPAAAVVEEIGGAWLKELFGLPTDASFAFTTGCQMAHATCLAAARNSVLREHGWDVERHGLCGAPPVRIVTGTNCHASLGRAVRLLGLGTSSMELVPENEDGTLTPEALEAALKASRGPTIVVLNAGDLNIGAFDPFGKLIPLAKKRGAWVHVDGAFGLWVAASARRRHLIAGAELADSWATDAHKWLNVPYDSGIAFVRDAEAHRRAVSVRVAYVEPASDARDPIDYTPEWSRRARGFPVYAALRELGREGLEALIDRTCDLTSRMAKGLGQLPGSVVPRLPEINQALVMFRRCEAGADEEDHDRLTAEVVARVTRGGQAYFTDTVWRGRRAMRVSLCNWRTTEADVDRSVAAVARALEASLAATPNFAPEAPR